MTEHSAPMIEVRNLCYEVGDHRILHDISFSVARGEVFGVMGMSGSGKSTLLKILLGLLPVCGGEVLIQGQSIVGLAEGELMEVRAKMGMCFQYSALFDSMTVGDNVAFGLRRQGKLSEDEIRRRVIAHLEDVGLHGSPDRMPSELSGGMRKRVGIARALIMQPDILLYDEPSAGLDPIMAAVIDELVLEVTEKHSITSVVVTHEVEELFGISDRVMMIHEGRVVACDTPEALRAAPHPVVRQFVEGSTRGPIAV